MINIYLSEKKKIDWNPFYHRIRYNDHIINLAIYSFLFQDSMKAVEDENLHEEEKY
jgi:hypothetical protein